MNYILSIDIGTTSTKTIIYDTNGKIKASSNNTYPLYQDIPDMAEEDPEEIFSAIINGASSTLKKAKLKAGELKGVALSCFMHSLILLDKNHRPLTRAITLWDNRAVKYAEKLKSNSKGMEIYKRTGTPIHPMSPLCKLIWLKNDHPHLFKKARWFVGVKEYILYKLFGVLKEDYSIASNTGLFNIFKMNWDTQALKTAGISATQLPQLVDTTYQLKGIRKKYMKILNISSDTPFVIGASDGPLANLGVDAIKPGVVAVTIGTSAAVRIVSRKPHIDPKARVFCYYLSKDMWVIGGPINNGGIVFRWVRDRLCQPEKITAEQLHIDPYDLLTKIAKTVPTGSDGLIFLPFLGGERAPIWDANSRGTFFGLNRIHSRAHMIRAVLEGIVYNLYNVLLALEEVVGKPKIIRANGGFARSKFWCQILTDIFEHDVMIPESYESTALGAATLGMYSLGFIKKLSEVSKFIGTTDVHHPNPKAFPVYRQLIPIYIRLSRILKPEYKSIAEFQRKQKK